MRRFELVEGSASKFWEVSVAGTELTVRYGRIGTAGQSKTKSFDDEARAGKERETLIREKTGKGYVETGVDAQTASPAAAVASPPAPRSVPAPVPVPADTSASLPAEAAHQPVEVAKRPAPLPDHGTIPWPTGGFQWQRYKPRSPLALRGVHIPPAPDLEKLLAEPPSLRTDLAPYHYHRFHEICARLKRDDVAWDPATVLAHFRADILRDADDAAWFTLLLQSFSPLFNVEQDAVFYGHPSAGLRWLAEAGLGVRGLPCMVERAIDAVRILSAHDVAVYSLYSGMLTPLRRAVASSADDVHADIRALLEARSGDTAPLRRLRAHLMPTEAAWAREVVADDGDDDLSTVLSSRLPIDELLTFLISKAPVWSSRAHVGLLSQLADRGEAALPLIACLAHAADSATERGFFIDLIALTHTPEMPEALAALFEHREARIALDELAKTYPAAVMAALGARSLGTSQRDAEGWVVKLALHDPVARDQVLAWLDAPQRARLQQLLAELQVAEASPDQLPSLLRDPPWLSKARAAEPPVLTITVPETPGRFLPSADLPVRTPGAGSPAQPADATELARTLTHMLVSDAGQARLHRGESLLPEDIMAAPSNWYSAKHVQLLLEMPAPVSLALWNSYPPHFWYDYGDHSAAILALLDRHGADAIPGLVNYTRTHVEKGLLPALAVESPEIAALALNAIRHLKKARPAAVAWITRHAAVSAAKAVTMAFAKEKATRDIGQHGLRWMSQNGLGDVVEQAATAAGEAALAAVKAELATDPLLILPARMPKLPGFFVAPAMRRPVLKDGGAALPVAAMNHLAQMLAISTLQAPYAGLAVVKSICTPASLAVFAWDVFEAWLLAGAPSKEAWAFTALGLLGDDETARRLAPRIREWPGQSANQRAVTGLDLLAAIGTDTALMHLNGIAAKVKFKALQERAREKIAALAEARGLTAAELADRLVPDLGLDDDGALTLDFGPRQFTVRFDETLKPFVQDARGVRLKDLPKPIRSDDAALATDATERYKQLKKDAKAIASLQIQRLELGMVDRRRWSGADFRLFFLDHPLMRHLAARLAWGVYVGDAVSRVFRVAEDWTLADADDALTTLDDDATVGIAHPLELTPAMSGAIGQVFADYEILQPFRQLGRESYALTDEERAGTSVTRFADRVVSSGSIMGLVNRGWRRGEAQDAGWIGHYSRPIGDDLQIDAQLDPGVIVGDPSYEPKQRIPKVVLRRPGTWEVKDELPLSRLHPITASEILRDLSLLAPYQDKEPAP